jgi:DNA repair photolyase
VLLRLPLEISGLMREWLAEHHPDKLNHVFSLVQSTRGGKDYDSRWGLRMSGTGPYAWMIGRRFEIAAGRLGLNARKLKLRTDLFVRPREQGAQLALF